MTAISTRPTAPSTCHDRSAAPSGRPRACDGRGEAEHDVERAGADGAARRHAARGCASRNAAARTKPARSARHPNDVEGTTSTTSPTAPRAAPATRPEPRRRSSRCTRSARRGLRLGGPTMLVSSIARVIGPTPPGLGLTQPATSATSGATSPAILPSTRLTPTSSTAAPGLTMSPVMRPGTPAAATTMSAWRTSAARSRGAGVAQRDGRVLARRVRMRPSGRPTVRPRPTTTTWAPAIGTSWRRSSSTMPTGVHGSGAGSAQHEPAEVEGVQAVDVLGRVDRATAARTRRGRWAAGR